MLARCRKLLALLTLLSGVFHASHILALGLGELTVNSSLNEPLDASIQLLGLDGLTDGQIQASLGGVEDFERANIDRVGLIDVINLEVIISNSQEGILRLTSREAVVEPFLSMVISVRWPNGRLMRDYTALIDLPNFISTEPQVVPVDIPQTPAPVQEPEPIPAPVAQPQIISSNTPEAPQVAEPTEDVADTEEIIDEIVEPAPEAEPEAIAEAAEVVVEEEVAAATPDPLIEEDAPVAVEAVADETVTIESGNTLYDIAAQNRPGTSVSVEQTMQAIQRANPDAFIDNNVNMIRVGQVLRIPSIQDIQSIDQSQALEQIAQQNQAVSVQPLAFSNNQGAGGAQGADELTILGGEDGTDSLSGNSDMAETIAALENQLAISEENLDRARLENQELMARFGQLTEQIEILQNIIAMQDERLAQLQADLASSAAQEAEEVAAQPAPIVETPAQTPQTDNSLMGQLSSAFENTLVLVSSLVGLILLVVGFLVWRRRMAYDGMEDFDLETAADAAPILEDVVSEEETEESAESDDNEDIEAFDFDLNDSPATATDTASGNEPEESEDSDVEAFDFSLNEAESSPEVVAEDEPADVESFEFNVEESAEQSQPEEAPAEGEEVETLDFDVSAVSSFEETPEVQTAAEDAPEESLETFSFDSDDADSTGAAVAEEQSLESLAAALDEIDAEDADVIEIELDNDTEIESVDDLDLGDIEIDDSLFVIDDEGDSGDEPITDRDEASTKLDLAVAYEAMGDKDGAREILNEVIAEGNDEQVSEAEKLLEKWDQ